MTFRLFRLLGQHVAYCTRAEVGYTDVPSVKKIQVLRIGLGLRSVTLKQSKWVNRPLLRIGLGLRSVTLALRPAWLVALLRIGLGLRSVTLMNGIVHRRNGLRIGLGLRSVTLRT